MSRAFVNEDAASEPEPRYILPERDDPGFDLAAAWAMLEGANVGNSRSAQLATGYAWGDPALVPHMRDIRDQCAERGEDRFETLARRFLRAAGADPDA